MSVVLHETWPSLSPPPRVFSGISLRPPEAPGGNYVGLISCTFSYTEMIFGTIFKYSKTKYMQKEVQRFIKKQKSYVVLTVSGLSLDGGGNAAKHYLQNSVIVSTWMQITSFLLCSLSHTLHLIAAFSDIFCIVLVCI